MSHKIAVILTPSETPFYDSSYFRFSPLPLSLGILQGYLRARGYTVSSTDLNTRMFRFANRPEARQWLPLYDKGLILRHLTEGAPTLIRPDFRGLDLKFHTFSCRAGHYGIRIHRSPDEYDKILQRSAEILAAFMVPHGDAGSALLQPYHIWRYSEPAGRSVERIVEETEVKFRRMLVLMSNQLVPRERR